MLGSRVPFMQELGQSQPKLCPIAHRGLEQSYLYIARNVAPDVDCRLSQ